MPWKETLFERRLSRPFDHQTRQAIDRAYRERRHEIPMDTELHWHPARPQFTIKAPWLSLVGQFTPEKLVIDAELSLAAKMMANAEMRRQATAFFSEIADDLNL